MSAHSISTLLPSQLAEQETLSKVAKDGIFYLNISDIIPAHLIEEAIKFSYRFPKDAELKQYTDGQFGGYHDREHAQIESFYVEKGDWAKVLPKPVQTLASKMDEIVMEIFTNLLTHVDIPTDLWDKATGNVTAGKGQRHFAFNHYRPEKAAVGVGEHLDFGFITMLFIEKSGLQAQVNGEWIDVPPKDDCFVVMVNRAFELLVNDSKTLKGVLHRVNKLSEERTSFTATIDNDRHTQVSAYDKEKGALTPIFPDYDTYLAHNFEDLHPST